MAARGESVNARGAHLNRVQINCVNNPDDGGVNRGVGAAHSGHRGKTFGGQQDAFADARVHGIERQYWVAAIRTVKIERLNDEYFSTFMGRRFLRCYHIADDAANEHVGKLSVESRKFQAKIYTCR